MIPLDEVTVVGSDSTVLSWPVKARLESIGIVPNKMQIRTSNTGHWQAVPIDQSGTPAQSGTLWVFEYLNGKWYASGAERLRPSQLNGDKPVADPSQGGLATLIGKGWLYDANRWGPMAGHNPKAGDIVGFMIASGSTRLDTNSVERERTDIVVCRWPDAAGCIPFEVVWREGAAAPEPVTRPEAPEPVARPEPRPEPTSGAAAPDAEIARLTQMVESLMSEVARQRERIDALEGVNTATNERIDQAAQRIDDLSARMTSQQAALDGIAEPRSAHVTVFGTRIPVSFE